MVDEKQPEIRSAFAAKFATKTRDEWVDLLGAKNTCVAPVNTVAEAVVDEQYAARGLVADAVSPADVPFRQAAPIWAGTDTASGPYEIREGTLTDTAALLKDAGIDPGKIEHLLNEGVIA